MERFKDLKEGNEVTFRIVGECDLPKEEDTTDIPPELQPVDGGCLPETPTGTPPWSIDKLNKEHEKHNVWWGKETQ